MKRYFFALLFLCSMSSFSQNDLFGNWHLLYINYNGTQTDNYFNDGLSSLDINFTETLLINGSSPCNTFFGIYTHDAVNSTIGINQLGQTLQHCLDMRGTFESRYVGNTIQSNNQ